ncbi:MAG: hypothetical protein WBN09_03095 [Woeseiaceae bacterium]
MKPLDYAKLSVLASALALAACDSSSGGFIAKPGGGGGAGGGGGVGGGGGGGGIIPTLQYGPAQQSGYGDIRVSGDASKIVFIDDSDPRAENPNDEFQLFSLNIGTGEVIQITDGSATAVSALDEFDLTDSGDAVVWVSSSDFTGDNPNNFDNVFIASTDTGDITQVTDNPGGTLSDPQVSGNGIIVFTSSADLTGGNAANDEQVFSINDDGSNLTQLTTFTVMNPTNLAFADGGSKIAFDGEGDPAGTNADGSREIFIMDVDGGNLAQLTATASDSLFPKISDDGSLVAFTTQAEIFGGGNADGNYEMYVAQSDGSAIVQITNNAENSGSFVDGTPGAFNVSGDGSILVFLSRGDLTGLNRFSTTVFWAATDGSVIQQLLREGTVPDATYANENFDADTPSITNDGLGIVFESTVNYTEGAVPTFQKIYAAIRQ